MQTCNDATFTTLDISKCSKINIFYHENVKTLTMSQRIKMCFRECEVGGKCGSCAFFEFKFVFSFFNIHLLFLNNRYF